jgi:hypothetical protein
MKSFTARIGLAGSSSPAKKDTQKLPTIGTGSSLAKQVSTLPLQSPHPLIIAHPEGPRSPSARARAHTHTHARRASRSHAGHS